jgi:protein gp37
MSDTTKIQWADATFNPWKDVCTKLKRTSAAYWKQPLKWNKAHELTARDYPDACEKGHRICADAQEMMGNTTCPAQMEKGVFVGDKVPSCGAKIIRNVPLQRQRIFPSLCDWLDDEVPIEWLAEFLKLIHDTPNLDWLLLTKRPENFEERIRECQAFFDDHSRGLSFVYGWFKDKAPENVWIGASVENQAMAGKRIPELLKIPARVRFLSVEPMLEAIDLDSVIAGNDGMGLCWDWAGAPVHVPYCDYTAIGKEPVCPGINWVIFGGESGPKARLCNVEWIRDGLRQCKVAGVAAFVKQLGANLSDDDLSECAKASGRSMTNPKGGDMVEWPEDLRVREFPQCK